MKATFALNLVLISIFLGSCFSEPEFSATPRIKLENICFGDALNEDDPDSLVVSLEFEDGDGDVGLRPDQLEEPFQENTYFVGNNGTLTPVGFKIIDPTLPLALNIPAGANGQLVVKSTRNDTQYSSLPDYNGPSSCIHYRVDSVLVTEADKAIIPANASARLLSVGTLNYYVVKDTLYFERNENFTNIDVRFFRKPNNESEFEEVDWYTLLCGQDFNGRFPVLSEDDHGVSGKIKYTMASTQFKYIMGSGIWQLKIQIKDRALNKSNVVTTQEFPLEAIRCDR